MTAAAAAPPVDDPVPVVVPAIDLEPLVREILVSPQGMSTVLGLLLPLLVGLITSPRWQPLARGLALLGLSFATSAGTELVDRVADGQALDWPAVALATLTTWVTGHVAHASLWRRTPLAHRLQQIGARPPQPPSEPAEDPRSVQATMRRARQSPSAPGPDRRASGRSAPSTPPYPTSPAVSPPPRGPGRGQHQWGAPYRDP